MGKLDRNFENDFEYGEKQEVELLAILQEEFNDEDLKLTDRYSKFDLTSDKYNIEIKSRKFHSSKYNTTMIPCNKCIIVDNKKTFIVINFTNAIYYIEYNEEQFKKYEIKQFSRQNSIEYDLPYYYINLSEFTRIQINRC